MHKKIKFPPIVIIGILFFIFGFVTWLNSTLVPYLKLSCRLTNFESYFVTFMFYIAYFVLAIPSSKVIDRIGYRRSMSLGLWIMALGAALFIPAAYTRYFLFFLTGLFLMGAGLALLQTAANPYAAILGPPETAARRISIMGVCNKFAGVLAPLILGSVILSDADVLSRYISYFEPGDPRLDAVLDGVAMKCLFPYICIMAALALLAVFVRFSPLPEIEAEGEEEVGEVPAAGTAAGTDSRADGRADGRAESCTDSRTDGRADSCAKPLRRPRFRFGVIALFFYVGVEVIGVDSLIGFALNQGLPAATARIFPAMSMIAFIIGYLIGIIGMPRIFSQRAALIMSSFAGMAVTAAAVLTPGIASLYILIWLGLANAMIWPAIWGISIEGLGRYTSLGSSLLIMAIVGGALLPLLFGKLLDVVSYRTAYLIALPVCYAVILAYALSFGSNKKN